MVLCYVHCLLGGVRFCTPEGYTAMITFAHADNTVKSIDLYAPET